jgi:hypothetical protein
MLLSAGAKGDLRIAGADVRATSRFPPAVGAGYEVQPHAGDGTEEVRLLRHGHHFATVLTQGGIFAFRPHPGVDRNGWGSTLYLQPFIATAFLGHAEVILAAATATGIHVSVTGRVSQGASSTFGSWAVTNLSLRYDPAAKRISGEGDYSIRIDGPVALAGGDLNLFRLASNFLDDVPLLDGSTGDTGDMLAAVYVAGGVTNTWIPPLQPGHFPGPSVDSLDITALGAFYDVDTLAQTWTNFHAIQAAYKPSLRVVLDAAESGYGMIPGFIYTTSESQLYHADNVGITPVIPASLSVTQFTYAVSVESAALAGDGTGWDVALSADSSTGTNLPAVEVYFEEEIATPRTNRLVGFLAPSGPTNYAGSLEVPRRPGSALPQGFFRLVAPAGVPP